MMPDIAETSYDSSEVELTILMPVLNEAETLAGCIKEAQSFLERHLVEGEILIADNGSVDNSPLIARERGARVVAVEQRGYGAALMGGIRAARGQFVIMGDADGSYNFEHLMPFLTALRSGHDLVMGNRFTGNIEPGSMPLVHRYLGNPALTGIGRLFFGSKIGDFHCGLRGFRRRSMERLNLQTTGMEFASEMVVKSTLHGLRVTEVPIVLRPDGRTRPPHLRTWRDGWRHLRFLLIFSPRWLFLYPGFALSTLGLALLCWLYPGPREVAGITFDIHTMLYGAAAVVVGLQAISLAIFARVYGHVAGFLPQSDRLDKLLDNLNLERDLLAGVLLSSAGLMLSFHAVTRWGETAFGNLEPGEIMRIAIPAFTMIVAGVQIVLGAFFLSVLEIPTRRKVR